MYKLRFIKLFYRIISEDAPSTLSHSVNRPCATCNLRKSRKIIVPIFNSYFLKNSVGHRGAILWKNICTYYTGSNFKTFFGNVQRDTHVQDILGFHMTSRPPCWCPKQRKGGHVGAPSKSSGNWNLLLCKRFLLFSLKNMAVDHVSENQQLILVLNRFSHSL